MKPNLRTASRIIVVTCVAIYSALFAYVYVMWASPTYHYLGLKSGAESIGPFLLASLSILGLTWMLPLQIARYSDFFCWIIFLVLLIPSLLIVALQGYNSFDANVLLVALCVSFVLIYTLPRALSAPAHSASPRVAKRGFRLGFFLLYAVCLSAVVIIFRDHMSLAGFDDVYQQRARATELGAGRWANYAVSWLANALNPYLLAMGLFDRTKRWMIAVGLAGQVVAYSVFAGKIILVSTAVMLAIAAFGVARNRVPPARLAIGAALLMVAVLLLLQFTDYSPTGLALVTLSQVYMRALAIQGALVGVYADFFTNQPRTLGSHITGFDAIVAYPYDAPLGIIIGKHLIGGAGFNANANFWATDGIAGFGIAGVILIGALVGLMLALANKIVSKEILPFAAVASLPFIMSLSNVSFFTSLLTGGGLLLCFLIANGQPRAPSNYNEGPK